MSEIRKILFFSKVDGKGRASPGRAESLAPGTWFLVNTTDGSHLDLNHEHRSQHRVRVLSVSWVPGS